MQRSRSKFIRAWARGAVRLCLVAVCALSLQSCGDGSKPNSAATAPAATRGPDTAPTAPPVSGPVTIGAMVWATAIDPTTKAPMTPANAFAESVPVIYAVVPVANVPAGASFTAVRTYNGTSLDALATTTVAPLPMASGWLEFHATMTPGKRWPVGSYTIVVKDSGSATMTGSVEVVRP